MKRCRSATIASWKLLPIHRLVDVKYRPLKFVKLWTDIINIRPDQRMVVDMVMFYYLVGSKYASSIFRENTRLYNTNSNPSNEIYKDIFKLMI